MEKSSRVEAAEAEPKGRTPALTGRRPPPSWKQKQLLSLAWTSREVFIAVNVPMFPRSIIAWEPFT